MKFKKTPKLSERIKYIRACFDLSQEELGKLVGTTQQAIQQAERGQARQPRYLHALARELDLPVEWVIFGEEISEHGQITQKPSTQGKALQDKSFDVLEKFYAMPKKDQELLYELMKSRNKKKD